MHQCILNVGVYVTNDSRNVYVFIWSHLYFEMKVGIYTISLEYIFHILRYVRSNDMNSMAESYAKTHWCNTDFTRWLELQINSLATNISGKQNAFDTTLLWPFYSLTSLTCRFCKHVPSCLHTIMCPWWQGCIETSWLIILVNKLNNSDSKVHGANMGPIWDRQDPGGPHVGPMDFAIWGRLNFEILYATGFF